MTLAIVDDPRFDGHAPSGPHPEQPARLPAARSGLYSALGDAETVALKVRPATLAEITRVHQPGYVDGLLERLGDGATQLDADTYACAGTRDAAWCAAGAAAVLGTALASDEVQRGIALLRPPGHHAEDDRSMGFCLLNNVAIAAEAARAAGADRVAIVDWDVHHGNGTQHSFEARGDVMFVSLHQWPLYPGTGSPNEVGHGAGAGTTINLALPSGSDDAVYGAAFRDVVLPRLAAFAPDVVLVSAGYDAHAADPLAGMVLSTDAYQAMASALLASHERVGFFLEGGYDLAALEASVAATTRAVLGEAMDLPEGRIPRTAEDAIQATLRALG
ncbi:MAG: histone deacetylase [Sandaracinaceae bacterium]